MTGYIFEHEGKQYSPDGQVQADNVCEHNAQIEQAELAYWATRPQHMTVYILPNPAYNPNGLGTFQEQPRFLVTTWRGVQIGRVIAYSDSKRYGSRYGEPYTMRSVRVAGNNGCEYVGRYGSDWAQCCNLRLAK